MKNSSNPNQHEKTNPKKSSNLQLKNLQPRTSSNNTPPINNTKSAVNKPKSTINSTESTQLKPSPSHGQLNSTKMTIDLHPDQTQKNPAFSNQTQPSPSPSPTKPIIQDPWITNLHLDHRSPPPLPTTPRKTRKTQRLESQVQRERGIESLNKERYKHIYAPRDREREDLEKKKKKDTDTNTHQ